MTQQMADLPPERVKPSMVFENCALDVCGPFMVSIKRSQCRRYILLIICLLTRSIHLETLAFLSTDSFMNGFRRFISRRGKPSKVFSDCGTNFVGAQSEIQELYKNIDKQKVQIELANRGIEWIFNPPYSSHRSGNQERQHRSVRKIMNGVLNTQVMTDESLNTLIVEIEAILNSRPLTVVSDDPKDLDPLTPNHFLSMKGIDLVGDNFTDKDVFSRKRWKHTQYLANLFWSRFRDEYLANLQDRQMWRRLRNNLSVNDIVIVVDRTLPRGQWPLGRVVEVHKSSDGLVRRAKVQCKQVIIERAISKLVLLLPESERAMADT